MHAMACLAYGATDLIVVVAYPRDDGVHIVNGEVHAGDERRDFFAPNLGGQRLHSPRVPGKHDHRDHEHRDLQQARESDKAQPQWNR